MRRIVRSAGIVAVLFLLVVASLPFLIDADQFRPMLQSELSKALGREVNLGHLSLSVLSGGVSATDISIADDSAFSRAPFVTAKSMKIGVELWPLISKRQLHVTGITIEQPQIALLQSASGDWNFSRLGSRSPVLPVHQPAAAEKSDLDLSVKLVKITGGRVSVGTVNGRLKPIALVNVGIEVQDFSSTSVFPFSLTANVAGGGDVNITGKAGPINPTDTALTPVEVGLKVTKLNVAASGFVPPSAGITGLMSLDGTGRSNGSALQVNGRLKADQLQLVKNGSPARRPVEFDFALAHDLKKRSGVLSRGDVHLGAAPASLTGTYVIHGESATLNLVISGPNMSIPELEALLPALGIVLPSGSSLQGGAANARLEVQGPVDRLTASGVIGLKDTRLTGFDLGSKLSLVAKLAGIQAGPNTDIQLLTANVQVGPEGTRADAIQFIVPSIGAVTGAGAVNAAHQLDFKMRATVHRSGGLIAVVGQGDTSVPFVVEGTASNPVFRPDVRGIAAGEAKALVGTDAAKKATGILGGLLSGLKGK